MALSPERKPQGTSRICRSTILVSIGKRLRRDYNGAMPVSPLISALLSGLINAAVDSSSTQPSDLVLQSTAQVRPFPAETRCGEMLPPALGEVVISGQSLPLAPGAQIRDTENRIVMPSSVLNTVPVRFMTDPSGAVFRVWILSAAEAAVVDAPLTLRTRAKCFFNGGDDKHTGTFSVRQPGLIYRPPHNTGQDG
jgi:hypothetical protein